MKMLLDGVRLTGFQPKSWLASFCLILAFYVVATLGCSKSSPPQSMAPASSGPTNASADSAPAPAPPMHPQSAIAADPNDTKTTLQAVNRALMHWMIKNHRHPRTFEEFSSTADTQIPDPPAGKKYTLNTRGFVILVDN